MTVPGSDSKNRGLMQPEPRQKTTEEIQYDLIQELKDAEAQRDYYQSKMDQAAAQLSAIALEEKRNVGGIDEKGISEGEGPKSRRKIAPE